jgi:hypothetical protein
MPVPRLPYELNPCRASFSMRLAHCQSECPFARRIVLTQDECYRGELKCAPHRPPHKKGVRVGSPREAQRQKAFSFGLTRPPGKSSLARVDIARKKQRLRNKEVVSAVPALFLQESALQVRNLDSPARKLQTRSAQSNQPLSAAFFRHNRNVSAALAKVIRVSIE